MEQTIIIYGGRESYSRKFIVDDMKFAWCITDYIDDVLQDLCEETAKLFTDAEHPMPEDFGCKFYEECCVGELRDAIILAAQDVMDCELVWDYPV